MKRYLPRIADKLLEDRLNAKGGVLIEGPKWCGKTTTAKQRANSFISMDKPDMAKPAFMAVLCAKAPFAYKRSDGVYVIPVATLMP